MGSAGNAEESDDVQEFSGELRWNVTRRQLLRNAAAATGAGALALIDQPVAAATAEASADRYYVAVDGDDSWSGRRPSPEPGRTDGPFATLGRARDAVRELKAESGLTRPVEIIIRGGTYYLADPLELGPEDSGTERCPITWRASDGEKAAISGGRPITGTWTPAENGTYSTTIPDSWAFRTLFVNDRRATLARFPKPDAEQPGRSYLYHGGQTPNLILSWLAYPGDLVEYTFDAPTQGTYDLWIGVATTGSNNERVLAATLDGASLTLLPIAGSGGGRTVKYSKAATSVSLSAGTHRIRLERTTCGSPAISLDAFAFTTNPDFAPAGMDLPPVAPGEQRVVIQAEDDNARVASYGALRFRTYAVASLPGGDKKQLHAEPALVKTSWKDDPAALVEIATGNQFFSEQLPIVDIEDGTGVITVDLAGGQRAGDLQPGNYFLVSGVREELDAPGEFYVDAGAGRLDHLPRAGEDLATSTFVAPVLTRLVTLRGNAAGEQRIKWVTIRGLTFTHCGASRDYPSLRSPTDAAIQLDSAWHCTIEDCHITGVDGYGIWLHLDSCENTVARNEIDDTGVGGVLLTGAVLDYGVVYDPRPEVQEYAPLRNAFVRNHIHNGGKLRIQAAGFNLGSRPASTALEPGNLIAFNHVHHMTRQGMFGFRHQGGNIVAYNYFHNLGTGSADVGAVNFALMTNISAPNLVRNNVIHDITGLRREGETEVFDYGFGFYLDHDASTTWLENNTLVAASFPAHVKGQFNTFFNNVIADPAELIISTQSVLGRGHRAQRNVIANAFADKLAEGRAYRLSSCSETTIRRARDFINSDSNLLYNAGDPVRIEPHRTLERWRAAGNDTHSLVAAPKFVNPEDGDYRLQPTSPAFQLGFAAIDVDNVGPDARAPLPGIATMAAVHAAAEAEPVGNDGRTTRFRPQIQQPGFYRVYARRTSNARPPQRLGIVTRHSGGESRAIYADLVEPGPGVRTNPPPRFGIYLGTHPFRAGAPAEITFFQPADEPADMPSAVELLRVPQLDTGARDLLWEVTAATDASKVEVGDRVQVAVQAMTGDGHQVGLRRATVRYSSDASDIADVSRSGRVLGLRDGLANITVSVEVDNEVVVSPPIMLIVGRILWDATLMAQQSILRVGESTNLTVNGRDDEGRPADLSNAVIEYASTDTTVASVDRAGVVTARGEGSATITATIALSNVAVTASVELVVAADVSPVLAYRFDESASGSEPAQDWGEPPAAPGEFHGSARRITTTPSGSGAALDLTAGGVGYVTPGVPGSHQVDGLPAFAICLWLALRQDPSTFDRFVGMGSAFDWYILRGSTASDVSTFLRAGSTTRTLPSFDARDWQFFAFVGDGNAVTVYRGDVTNDVTVLGELTNAGPLPEAPDDELRLGATTLTTADRTPPAHLDDFRVYDLALPVGEINRIRREGLGASQRQRERNRP